MLKGRRAQPRADGARETAGAWRTHESLCWAGLANRPCIYLPPHKAQLLQSLAHIRWGPLLAQAPGHLPGNGLQVGLQA